MIRIGVCTLAALLLAGEASAQVDLANATLDELMRISVTTATRKEDLSHEEIEKRAEEFFKQMASQGAR